MDKVAVARDVALKLSETEAAVDASIAGAARLIASLAEARGDLRLSATTGQEAAEHLSAALTTLVTARGQVVAAHGALAALQAQIGLRRLDLSVDMMGPLDKPPPPSGRAEEAAAPTAASALRIV